MSTRIDRPSIANSTGRNDRRLREHVRGPGELIYVGTYPGDPNTTPESPPFKNGHTNAPSGDGFVETAFYIDKSRRVHVVGAWDGALGTVVFTLPVGYRPRKSERFACAGDDGATIIQVDPNGDVTQIL